MTAITVSPANKTEEPAERRRIPMSVPQQRLAVNEIPGYYLYWMKGTPDRIGKAQQAGYEFVSPDEVQLNNFSIASDKTIDGNSDMGTRVSVIAGEELGADGQPIRLYLMKLKEEWHQEDLALQEANSQKTIDALKHGQIGSEGESSVDSSNRYVGSQSSSNFFQPKPLRRS